MWIPVWLDVFLLYQSTGQQCSWVKYASPGEQSLSKRSFAYLFHCLVLVQTIAFQCHIQLLIIGNRSTSSLPVTSGISSPSQRTNSGTIGLKSDMLRIRGVVWIAIWPPRREIPGSISTRNIKIHEVYGAIWRKILCPAAICTAGWFACMVVP